MDATSDQAAQTLLQLAGLRARAERALGPRPCSALIPTRCARSRAGRTYRLIGPPREHPEAECVWGRWRRMSDVETWTDVSRELSEQHLAANVAARRAPQAEPDTHPIESRHVDPLS
jgi:hypothetical protein